MYIYVYIYICIHIYVYIYVYVYKFTDLYTCIYIHKYVHIVHMFRSCDKQNLLSGLHSPRKKHSLCVIVVCNMYELSGMMLLMTDMQFVCKVLGSSSCIRVVCDIYTVRVMLLTT